MSSLEVEKELKIALSEIGVIEPWYDSEVEAWLFSHPLYPVEYAGSSAKEVVKKYPLYLKEFIKHRLQDNLDPLVEKATKGRGGCRPGAGRPRGSKKVELVEWIQDKVN